MGQSVNRRTIKAQLDCFVIYSQLGLVIVTIKSDMITQAVFQDSRLDPTKESKVLRQPTRVSRRICLSSDTYSPRFEASHERAGWVVVRTPPRSRQKKSYLVNPDQRENAEKGDRNHGAKASADSKANAEERTKKAGPFEHR
ncbi:hypothetical protein G5I_12985 [Acromyrmex echinatior]|uniref:Uncharacterized protein n=1 Tax=Acromyrmex echinatior TaxID=103372 RepID=F4X3S2_ACREC|nr:hypothetical protein G5I_12985 [Acromyrmex echinatior]